MDFAAIDLGGTVDRHGVLIAGANACVNRRPGVRGPRIKIGAKVQKLARNPSETISGAIIKRKVRYSTDERNRITLLVDPDVYAAMINEANKTGNSVNSIVRARLRDSYGIAPTYRDVSISLDIIGNGARPTSWKKSRV